MKTKLYFVLLALLLCINRISAQCATYTPCSTCTLTSSCNLVCNGGFESIGGDNGGVPTSSCQVGKACGWGTEAGSPDFFYSGGNVNFQVPCNVQGGENNHTTGTGTGGYVGIIPDCYPCTGPERIQTTLTSTMTAGAVYLIEFYLSLADAYTYNTTNAVGIDLRNSFYGSSVSGTLLVNETGVSAIGWTKFSITYTATGTEDILVIGGMGGSMGSVTSNTNNTDFCGTPFAGSGTYYYLDDVSVKQTFSITASANVISPCTGEPVILTGSGATTYTWTDGITSYTNNPLTITPSGPTTYTLSGTDGSGCSDLPDATITIRPASCCSNSNSNNIYFRNVNIVPYGTAGATTYTSLAAGNYYNGNIAAPSNSVITNTLTVMGTMSISANVTFSLCNISIQEDVPVYQYSTTTIDRSWLYGCGGLWSGILSYSGMTITNSFIEDAYIGLDAGFFLFISSHPGVTVDNAVFNKCYIGMAAGNASMTPGNFKVTGSIFTCRTISAALHDFTPGTRYVTSLAPLTSKVPTKLLGSVLESITANTIRTDRGIYFDQLVSSSPGTNFVVGAVSATSTLNATYTNIFDDINEGVYNQNTKLEIYNNQFSTMSSGSIGTTLGGIYHDDGGSNSNNTYTKVGSLGGAIPTANYKNVFKSVVTGVAAVNGGVVDVEYNDFNLISSYGVSIKSWYSPSVSSETVMIANNSFTDAAYCVYASDNRTITASVISNTAVLSQGTYSTNYNVYFNELSSTAGTTYYVHDNNFTGQWNGIYCTNTSNMRAVNNAITISKPSGSNKNAAITLDNSNNCFVGENNISCSPTNTGSANTAGINSNITPNTTYKCNTIQKVGACFIFKGACSPVSFYYNTMNSTGGSSPCLYGVLLDNNGTTGNIGYYNGFSWQESDDLWGDFSTADTYAQGTSTAAIIYYNAAKTPTADYTPIVNTSSLGSLSYTRTNNTNANSQACNETSRLANPNQGSGRGNSITQVDDFNLFAGHRKPIIMQLPDAGNAKTTQFGNEEAFYEVDSLINLFATSQDTSQLNNARSINNGISPANNIEQHQKDFNAIFCTYMREDSLVTAVQINDLTTMAQLCPFTEGTAIYQARALLRHWNDSTSFANSCEYVAQTEANNRFMAPAVTEEAAKAIRVYPNPSTGLLTVEGCSKICIFEIHDMLGRKLLSQSLSENATLVDLHALNNGTYLYKIIQDGQTIRQDKLVINR